MSSVLKINKGSKLNVKIKGMDGNTVSSIENTQEQMQFQIHNAYEKGLSEGYKKASAEIETKYKIQLKNRSEKLDEFLNEVNGKLAAYDENFNAITIDLAFTIAEKIIKEKIESHTSINKILSGSIKKVLGANNVIIKLNEKDMASLSGENKNLVNDSSYSKIKFEVDDSIEPGGCLIETDIGNVDGRIGAQLKELKKQLEDKVLMSSDENGY